MANRLFKATRRAMMTDPGATSDEQQLLWNGAAGRGWVEAQAALDKLYKPVEDLLIEGIHAGGSGRVLDVGCGTGGTTLAAARRLGANGHCVGIDISEPMLAAARTRAQRDNTPITFIQADAQTYGFEPASFERVISRFGVMFFNDPVRAFLNLRSASKDGSELRFVAWRSAAENPFMTVAERAAAPLLPDVPARRKDGPGQFAFADQNYVRRILEESSWTDVVIRSVDIPCSLPEGELLECLTQVGPVGRILQEADSGARARVIEAIRPALDPYVHGTDIRFSAACWMISAHASPG
jgi:SAM-dependent methyltransferase